jgi:hypothetical protein
MADKLDDLLKYAADQADAQVDYAAMHASVLKKAQAKKLALRRNVIRYGSMAAAAVLLVTVGLAALGQGWGMKKMSERGDDTAFYAAEQPQANEAIPEQAADGETIVGSAPNPETDATESYYGDSGSGSIYDSITPPPGCGIASCDTLYWAQEQLELPAVAFGESASVESDGEHYLCTVTGATIEDYDAYAVLVTDMYPGSSFAADENGCVSVYSSSAELMDGQYRITLSLAGDEMTIEVQPN